MDGKSSHLVLCSMCFMCLVTFSAEKQDRERLYVACTSSSVVSCCTEICCCPSRLVVRPIFSEHDAAVLSHSPSLVWFDQRMVSLSRRPFGSLRCHTPLPEVRKVHALVGRQAPYHAFTSTPILVVTCQVQVSISTSPGTRTPCVELKMYCCRSHGERKVGVCVCQVTS